MPCTTLLVGKKASYDGSTLVARNEDTGADDLSSKRFIVVKPEDQPRRYRSVISHVEIPLPARPLRYTCMPNADLKEGIWGAVGVNSENISMTATETLTSNPRVLGADPLVVKKEAKGQPGDADYQAEVAGGIGEEDLVTIVLPYIHSAREGVLRLGSLLEKYGTYEMNGIAFQDVDEIWWLETIGGHHWMARRVPDDVYVTMPNQLGLDHFDLEDAQGAGKEYLCSADLREWMQAHHLDLSLNGAFNPRDAFGSHSDADHVYNTPRAWAMQRYMNPRTCRWDGPDADFTPRADDIPWCRKPERKITVEDVKEMLSNHYQGTPYDPYGRAGHAEFRPIAVNRTSQLALVQIRPYLPETCRTLEWVAFASNVFNAFTPFYVNVGTTPAYLAETPAAVSTDSYFWASRLIGVLADAHFQKNNAHIERYQLRVLSRAHEITEKWEQAMGRKKLSAKSAQAQCEAANAELAAMLREETDKTLDNVLREDILLMKNGFARSDA